jgi:hypothetical protein
MIQKTKWKPDTCECVYVYEWDDTLPNDQIVHTLVEADSIPCRFHNSLPTDVAYANVISENTTKNVVLGDAIAQSVTAHVDVETPDGTFEKEWKKGYEPKWSFDKSRNLVVQVSNKIPAAEKTAIETAVQNKIQSRT